jgi:hypothetical protein
MALAMTAESTSQIFHVEVPEHSITDKCMAHGSALGIHFFFSVFKLNHF